MWQYLDDPRNIELEFHEIFDYDNKEYLPMELAVEDEDIAYLPKLDQIDNTLHEIEHKFRKALEF